jgi:hypothetical protein
MLLVNMKIRSLRILTILKWIFLLLVYPFIFFLIMKPVVFVIGNMSGYFVAYQYVIGDRKSTAISCSSNNDLTQELHDIYCRENQSELMDKLRRYQKNK